MNHHPRWSFIADHQHATRNQTTTRASFIQPNGRGENERTRSRGGGRLPAGHPTITIGQDIKCHRQFRFAASIEQSGPFTECVRCWLLLRVNRVLTAVGISSWTQSVMVILTHCLLPLILNCLPVLITSQILHRHYGAVIINIIR